MYPARELTIVADRRRQLLRRIELRRRRFGRASRRFEQEVRRLTRWGRILYAAGVIGAAGAGWRRVRRSSHQGNGASARGTAPSRGRFGRVLRWAPVVLRVARLVALRR